MNQPPVRILLVDDYPDALETWTLYLRSLGYEVATTGDGVSAVELATSMRPDIVVMDLELPGMSGVDAAKRLRASPETASIPLIAATGYSHLRQLDEARAAGFDVVLVKPCDPAGLVDEIRNLLARQTRAR